MKQLIKLSQDLIPADQIEAEIEKQSMTLEGTGSNAAEPNAKEQPSSEVKSRLGSERREAADSIGQEMLEEDLYDPGSATYANSTMRNT